MDATFFGREAKIEMKSSCDISVTLMPNGTYRTLATDSTDHMAVLDRRPEQCRWTAARREEGTYTVGAGGKIDFVPKSVQFRACDCASQDTCQCKAEFEGVESSSSYSALLVNGELRGVPGCSGANVWDSKPSAFSSKTLVAQAQIQTSTQ